MPAQTIELGDFLERFSCSIDEFDGRGSSEYTLILGAGASRSAGIPTAKEMIEAFKQIAAYRGRSTRNPGGETDWSFLFRAAFGDDEYGNNEFEGEDQEFITRVVSLASREPNLTNLIAANLAAMQIFPLVVTTNYDDLLLAGFWSLPPKIPYSEPHIVYNPRDKFSNSIWSGATAPLVIKAHGHHTDYGHEIGILDHEISRLAPYVKRAIKRQPRPRIGYIVVGYSGTWDDGIIAAFKDRNLMAGSTVYWFFRDAPPAGVAEKIWRTANVYFIKCPDSDLLFLKMWHEVGVTSDYSLEPGDLFSPLLLKDRGGKPQQRVSDETWWKSERPFDWGTFPPSEQRRLLSLDKLIAKVIPILAQCDDWEEKRIINRCLPDRVKTAGVRDQEAMEDALPPAIDLLRQAVPARVSWGRRDRRLLRLALDPEAEPLMSAWILDALAAFS